MDKNQLNAYKESGVDSEKAGNLIKNLIKNFKIEKSPLPENYFCQLLKIPFAPANWYLAMGTDGIGTKLLLGLQTGLYQNLGQDLVGMIYNDLITSGAKPVAFLDYYATGKLEEEIYESVIRSVLEACQKCGMVLLGGETAEMPGLYEIGHFDMAGFGIGWVEGENILSPERIKAGQILLGFPSSGFHSNGYSLIRKIIKEKNLNLDKIKTFNGETKPIKEFLLEPTKLYAELNQSVIEKESKIAALVHITGGGYFENIPRALPENVGVVIEKSAFDKAHCEIFHWFAEIANLTEVEMLNIFNCGYGMVAFVDKENIEKIKKIFPEVLEIGYTIKSKEKVTLA